MFSTLTSTDLTMILIAYLLGSVSTAIILARWSGMPDPREQGSGNPGATNMLRIGNRSVAVLTLLGDACKGFLPIWLGQELGLSVYVLSLIGLAAVLGHLFPVFFQFRGGKGVATTLGVCLGLSPLLGVLQVGCWLIVAISFHISSLAALVTALITPALCYWLAPNYLYIASALALLTVFRHRRNLSNLLHGEEPQL